MPSMSKDINQSKKRTKTPEKINPLTLFILIYLVKNNLPTRVGPIRKIKTIKEILNNAENKDRIAVMTLLSQVPTLFLKKKKKIFFISNTLTIDKKVITLLSIFR